MRRAKIGDVLLHKGGEWVVISEAGDGSGKLVGWHVQSQDDGSLDTILRKDLRNKKFKENLLQETLLGGRVVYADKEGMWKIIDFRDNIAYKASFMIFLTKNGRVLPKDFPNKISAKKAVERLAAEIDSKDLPEDRHVSAEITAKIKEIIYA